MIPNLEYLTELKIDTLATMKEVYECSKEICEKLDGTSLVILKEKRPDSSWYGWFVDKQEEIQVYERTVADDIIESLDSFLKKENVPDIPKNFLNALLRIDKKRLYDIINQSGMDHELAGHAYNYFLGKEYGELIACQAQMDLARKRAENDKDWEFIVTIFPMVSVHHKGVQIQ